VVKALVLLLVQPVKARSVVLGSSVQTSWQVLVLLLVTQQRHKQLLQLQLVVQRLQQL
jgi:hypothetical protein